MSPVTRILLGVLILTGVSMESTLVAAAKPGSITGTLRNDQGQAFQHVMVEATSPALPGQGLRPDNSNADGVYDISELPPGTYSLKFMFMRKYDERALSGRGRIDCATRDKVVVRAGRQTTVDATLKYCGDFTYETIRSGDARRPSAARD